MSTDTRIPFQRTAVGLLLALIGIWLIAGGRSAGLSHVRVAWGLFLIWVAFLYLRSVLDSIVNRRLGKAGQSNLGKFLRLPLNILLTLTPGGLLLWYGLAAPAQPSLTRGGVDVCEFQVGLCVSGTRALAVFGGALLLMGLALVISMVRQALAGRRPSDSVRPTDG